MGSLQWVAIPSAKQKTHWKSSPVYALMCDWLPCLAQYVLLGPYSKFYKPAAGAAGLLIAKNGLRFLVFAYAGGAVGGGPRGW